MGWLARRREQRHQAQLDAIRIALGPALDDMARAQARDRERDDEIAAARRGLRRKLHVDIFGNPLPDPTPEQQRKREVYRQAGDTRFGPPDPQPPE